MVVSFGKHFDLKGCARPERGAEADEYKGRMEEAGVPPDVVEDEASQAAGPMKDEVHEVLLLLSLAPCDELGDDGFGGGSLLLVHCHEALLLDIRVKADENNIIVGRCPHGPEQEGAEGELEEGRVVEAVLLQFTH